MERTQSESRHTGRSITTPLLHALFFLSGAAALVYQVTWARSLSLVFGGTHLAVATVLAVFMGGLALGSALLGRRADRTARPLRLYGMLELGIGVCGLGFMLFIDHATALYAPLARTAGGHPALLTALRVALAAVAMIVPTTLMGGTLPVLSRLVAVGDDERRGRVALLYAVNTLGAVAGVLLSGFVLLRQFGVDATMAVAVGLNVLAGAAALAMGRAERAAGSVVEPPEAAGTRPAAAASWTVRFVLGGIAVGGFCALGYEVLWTRTMTMVVGTSTYSFAIMLAAFLSGIALGSILCGAWLARRRSRDDDHGPVMAFALVEIALGAAALATTVLMSRLPEHALRLQGVFGGDGPTPGARNAATAIVAVAVMLVPAVLSGAAFPLAAAVVAAGRRRVGRAVGDVATFNTAGAILGAAAAGFVLVQAYGVERSLLLLIALQVGAGVVIAARAAGRGAAAAAAVASLVLLVALGAGGARNLLWNPRYFAIFVNNQRDLFESRERIERGFEIVDVVYYHEGVNETISVIRPLGGDQAFIVNGRSEATTVRADMQCQYALGHVPMLLHPAPARVFVLGSGSGMTLGATTLHPEARSITLAEIERDVLPATRTFAEWNHRALDNPKVRIVHDDGRNFLAVTDERFDVITADPIHPWSGGASYLYTDEYFRLAASRLAPGGVIAQWLPLYELTPQDVGTVVRTFARNFEHVLVWMTWWDAELIGSNQPFAIDPEALAKRASASAVAADLSAVNMAGATGLLDYCLTGTRGALAFADAVDGRVNTDDNLRLEFSAPHSIGRSELMAANMAALIGYRETPPELAAAGAGGRPEAARLADRAHVLALGGALPGPEFASLTRALAERHPDYAPGVYLRREEAAQRAAQPRPLASERFFITSGGRQRLFQPTAVAMRPSERWSVVAVVDPDTREMLAEAYLPGAPGDLDLAEQACASEFMAALRASWIASFGATVVPQDAERALALARNSLGATAAAWDRRLPPTVR
ncbi:MAG: spermidine synthase [Gemmatimonas sp.]|nr:spermidine synthase [Gemmatimonas sp.]